MASDRPNVLFMIADDHRHQAIHAMGDRAVQTPTMDGLIARGSTFLQTRHCGSFSPAVCMPARCSLHAGRGVFEASVDPMGDNFGKQGTIRPECPTMAQVFRDAGYQTFATGKWHNDMDSFNRSFETGSRIFLGGMCDHLSTPTFEYQADGNYSDDKKTVTGVFSTDMFTDAAIDFVGSRDEGRPFFAYVSFTSPHDPRMAPEPWGSMYDPDGITVPPNFMPEHPFNEGDHKIRDEVLAGFPRSQKEVRQHIADYYAMITHQDHHMGRLLSALEQAGVADNTIVVYTADHGLGVGQHGLLGKQNMYEHSVRVPMLISGPNVPQGKRFRSLANTPDIYPTLCDLAGLTTPDTVTAKSLAPIMQGEADSVRDHVTCLYMHFQRMITDGNWKYIRYYEQAPRGGTNREQLFDLSDDPWEMTDLSASPFCADRKRELSNNLTAWQREAGDPLVAAG